MTSLAALTSLHHAVFARIEAAASWVLPTLARFIFAATLLVYFWHSAATKLGDGVLGILRPSTGAYAQIFPKAFEAVGYDASQLSVFHWVVAVAGMWAEFILPALIVLGLFTRLAALGMIGFVTVQSIVDIAGHDLAAKDIGGWFDGTSGALILDQRAFWVLVLVFLVMRGAGPLSVDRLLGAQPVSAARVAASQPR